MKTFAIGAVALAATFALAGCGSSSDNAAAAPTSPTPASASATPAGYSDTCREAALDWQSKATEAVVGLMIGTSSSDLTDGMEQSQNHAHVACGDDSELYTAMSDAAYKIASVNAGLAVAGKTSKADMADLNTANVEVKKVRTLAQ